MKIQVKKIYKSIRNIQAVDLPDFVVLTGKNGSGKSHFMEAMTKSEYCSVFDGEGKPLTQVKYIPFNGLNPHIEEKCEYLGLTNTRKQAWQNIRGLISEYEQSKRFNPTLTFAQFVASRAGRVKILGKLGALVNWDVKSITEELFAENYEISSDEIFSSQFASIFKLYNIRDRDNKFNKYLNEFEGECNKVLTDEEFVRLYGPKPWDLINKMLTSAGLSYQVNHPEGGGNKELDFNLHLTDINSGTEIRVNDLSTGEKVLMSLALSIYNTKEETARPDVLLLDEPDAALHPEFSKVLVHAIQESIVKEAKVKVMISTHSPMTVVLAPEESIFLMDKAMSKPVKITKKLGVNILTKDLDNLRLSFEKRRQVFVESMYDVQYYERIINLIGEPLPTIPQFLPPRSSSGSNCDEVSSVVQTLRRLGNDLVYGIKDFDERNHPSDHVLVLGENKRYAIDNYVLDPIYVAFLLIRERLLKTEDIGLPPLGFVQLQNLDGADIQKMIDYVVDKLGLGSENVVKYKVQSGQEFTATHEYFMMQGHELEAKIKATWNSLNGIAHRGDNALKNYVLDYVCAEYPGYISVDIVDLFKKIV